MHQGAALLHDFQWGPNLTELVQLVNSIGMDSHCNGAVDSRHHCILTCSLSSATHGHLFVTVLYGGADFALTEVRPLHFTSLSF